MQWEAGAESLGDSKVMEESKVRAMRDKVYGVPTTDGNWDACRNGWMHPESIKWLEEQCMKIELETKDT